MFKPSVRPRGLNAINVKSVQGQKVRAERREVIRSAKLSHDGGNDTIDCTIRDISVGGARISTAKPNDIQNSFLLICRADDLVARCAVAWRRGHELGLRFVRRGTLAQEADFRSEQARAFQAAQNPAQQQTIGNGSTFKANALAQAQAMNFKIMQLDPTLDYTPDQLKRRYRMLAMRAHPDHGGDVMEFQKLTRAYQSLAAAAEKAGQPA